jgi:hypothetical protein
MLAQVPEAVPTVPPPSNSVDEPDVPGVDIPVPDELPVSALVLDKFPAIELMPLQVAVLSVAGPSGEAPDVIGLTPGDASSVAPRGIPVGATAGAGPMPSGEVIPSGDAPGGDMPIPPTCAEAALPPNSIAATTVINRRVIGISLPVFRQSSRGCSAPDSTTRSSHPPRQDLPWIAAICSRLRRHRFATGDRRNYARLRRYAVGVSPVALRKADVNELVSLKPMANPTSVTEDAGLASSALASSIRRSL